MRPAFSLAIAILVPLSLMAGADEDWRILSGQALHSTAVKDYANAEATYNSALRVAEVFGERDVRVASTLQGLARVLQSEKKWAQAEDAARRAVAIYSASPGDKSLQYAECQSTLASVLMDEGKYQAALRSIQTMLPLLEQNLGPDAGNTADAICMQGDSYRMLKMYASAETPLKRCAELRSDYGNAGDIATPEFGEAAYSLALVYQHLGKYADADRYFVSAARIREQSLGIQSTQLAETLEAHAVLLHQLGRDSEATQKERMAAAIRAHAARK